ncbi:MAG: N-acetylmuramoyl-L-alanine amidase [Candidatus Obscuribacterales bacterium]|nr:N-acetylmuramoyl-L-alanine amidase [Candidatus Obscuribacterales bacterium]
MVSAGKQIDFPEMKKTCWATFVILLVTALSNLSACAQLNQKSPPKKGEESKVRVADASVLIPKEPIGIKKGNILLVYPRGENENKIDSASTFFVGAVPAGSSLTLNGSAVSLNADGYFSQKVALSYGKNHFKLLLSGQESEPLDVDIERPAPKAQLSAGGFNILPESLEPKENLGVQAGDLIQFSARATPGMQMYVQLGGRRINLQQALLKQGKLPSVNLGLDTAFGVSFQRSPALLKDLYLGFYKVQASDQFQNASPVFVLQQGTKVLKARAKGSVSVLKQAIIMQTLHKNTIVRLGPGAARITPLPESVRLLCDAYKGDWLRLEYCPNRHVWIAKEDLSADTDVASPPQSRVTTVNLDSDEYGARIGIPLNQRLAFQLEHDPERKLLLLRIFGATADTDFVSSDLQGSQTTNSAKLIDYINWKQKGDLHYELAVHLKQKQCWGYWADYEDNKLVLHVKAPPAVNPESDSLKGAIICVDPGHGGKEIGSIGCSGVKEARLNFEIADKLRQELEKLGATVIMTRRDDSFVSLQERVDTAIAAKADLLLSVHNNALPDGRDPQIEHGTSSYWYHPQSLAFARFAQGRLSKATAFKDYGCRYQNLALCRPTQMPAVLMEIGFMINPDELSSLLNPKFQDLTARSIAGSVKEFIRERLKLEKESEGKSSLED